VVTSTGIDDLAFEENRNTPKRVWRQGRSQIFRKTAREMVLTSLKGPHSLAEWGIVVAGAAQLRLP